MLSSSYDLMMIHRPLSLSRGPPKSQRQLNSDIITPLHHTTWVQHGILSQKSVSICCINLFNTCTFCRNGPICSLEPAPKPRGSASPILGSKAIVFDLFVMRKVFISGKLVKGSLGLTPNPPGSASRRFGYKAIAFCSFCYKGREF